MAPSSPVRQGLAPRFGLPAGIMVAGAVILVLQVVFDRAVLGPLGLVGLVVPAIAVVRSIGRRGVGLPERVLATLTIAVVVAVLAGVLTAFSPRGLDASSVAVIELAVTVAAILVSSRRGGSVVRRRARPAKVEDRDQGPLDGWAVAGIGLILGLAGVEIAIWAAATQPSQGYIQFWSVPPTGSSAATVNVWNASGAPASCDVSIDRSGASQIIHGGTLADGQGWTAPLPSAAAGDTTPWHLYLECTSPGANPVYRQLLIDPPA